MSNSIIIIFVITMFVKCNKDNKFRTWNSQSSITRSPIKNML
ncbi:hypothetical protein XBO1_1950028 [Xenorhabdus bovienii str. oregonense]|uniref:Uncharacterized protein n=1 Tax=Xenorhabdus bovienii str. oregonense TaxID=1398202 RepID=A0A077NTQ1_XENBV|nr:hypothetical protein XBO1_1950028 [Xenorhabdus bovienii str. oregonense]